MNKKTNRNIKGLLQYAATLKSDSEAKVNQAIDNLKRSKIKKINFKTVSEISGISTTTLYNNPVLRERIKSLRAITKKTLAESAAFDVANRDREQSLRQEIHKLREEKKMLITQLVELENLKIENKKLKELLSKRRLE